MTASLCKHVHPIQPPHGSFTRPGDCTDCGMTWEEVQDELRRQEQALMNGTSREGLCPDCHQFRRLYRYQPQEQSWHPMGTEMPVGHLCGNCWNDAANAERALASALVESLDAL